MALAGQTRAIVERTLGSVLDRLLARLAADDAALVPIGDAIRALCLRGGKRLRPVTAVAGYVAAGGDRPEDAAVVATGLELLQTYLLIHDDWMDADEERRGGPTVHVALRASLGPGRADAGAVLAGDLCSAVARSLLVGASPETRDRFPADRLVEAQRVYVGFEEDVVVGQMIDLRGLDGQGDVEVLEDLKTGSYTVRGPLRLGAALAGASAELLAGLDTFGRPLGRAFQIRDDLLGLFGDPARTGKAVGRDLRAGKRTWIVDHALRTLPPPQGAALRRLLGDPESAEPDLAGMVETLATAGPRQAAESRVAALCTEARRQLDALPIGPTGRAELAELVDSLAVRDT